MADRTRVTSLIAHLRVSGDPGRSASIPHCPARLPPSPFRDSAGARCSPCNAVAFLERQVGESSQPLLMGGNANGLTLEPNRPESPCCPVVHDALSGAPAR